MCFLTNGCTRLFTSTNPLFWFAGMFAMRCRCGDASLWWFVCPSGRWDIVILIETSLFCVKFVTWVIINVTNLHNLFISQRSMMILCIRRYAMVRFDHGKCLINNERSEFCGLSEKSEYERPSPAHADAFERLISPRLLIRFPYGLQAGIDPFKLPWSQSDLAHFGGHPGPGG